MLILEAYLLLCSSFFRVKLLFLLQDSIDLELLPVLFFYMLYRKFSLRDEGFSSASAGDVFIVFFYNLWAIIRELPFL